MANTSIPATEIPVGTVILYSSGVAYFEHAGEIAGTAATELRFKAAQINDVLKSLVLQDTGGGKIGTIIYPSHDPVSKTLKSFQVDLTENPSLPTLLNQLRGAAVTVQLPTEKVVGSILGLEKRQKAVERTHFDIWMLNLLVNGTIRSVALDDVGALTLQDVQLQEELTRALGVVAQARDQDKKLVTIQFTGEGERVVRIGYVVEAPVWKSSYRLVLPKEGSSDPAHLQGWAIIENQTENDWTGIALTLVSGRPISFIQELYSPTYLPRPTVQPEMYASLRPQLYGAGIASAMAAAPAAGGALPAPGAPLAKRRASGMTSVGMAAEGVSLMEEIDAIASVSSNTETRLFGELFQYTVENVSLPRQRSAMIPIVTDPIGAERLTIYNKSVLARHPLYGLKLTNTTGKHLLQGPVTVLEASAYAGDARIDNLPPGQHRFLSYGIDLQVIVNASAHQGRAQIQTAKSAKGCWNFPNGSC